RARPPARRGADRGGRRRRRPDRGARHHGALPLARRAVEHDLAAVGGAHGPLRRSRGTARPPLRSARRLSLATVARMTAPNLDRSASWPYEDGDPGRFSYARDDAPPSVAVEETLGALDGGQALIYPSGMGAVTNVILTLARPGSTIA